MRINLLKHCGAALAIATLGVTAMSCDDGKSYAELLTDETHAVNSFLANHRVQLGIPEYDEIETGADAPFYRLDEEGNVYMQVLSKGNKDMMTKDDDLVYFRFTRNSLFLYDVATGEFPEEGWATPRTSPWGRPRSATTTIL